MASSFLHFAKKTWTFMKIKQIAKEKLIMKKLMATFLVAIAIGAIFVANGTVERLYKKFMMERFKQQIIEMDENVVDFEMDEDGNVIWMLMNIDGQMVYGEFK